jgi:hypothetical protein
MEMASLCGLTRPPRQVLPHPNTGRGEEEHPNNEHPNPSTDAASINRTAEQDRAVDAVDASIKNRDSSEQKPTEGSGPEGSEKKIIFVPRLNMKTTAFDEECLMLQGKGFADETSQGFGQGKLPAATVMKIQKLRKIREVRRNLTPSFAHPLVGPRWPVLHMKRVSGVTFMCRSYRPAHRVTTN